jgi:hypothetical protein
MKYDFSNWKPEEQEITRIIKGSYNNNMYDFFQDVANSYTFEEHLEMFPYIKGWMELRDKFLDAVASGEIKMDEKTYGGKVINTASLHKWCKKVGHNGGYLPYSYNHNKRDKLMTICEFVKLNSKDDDFVRYASHCHFEKLQRLYNEEKEWFLKHDEYTVISKRVSEKMRDLRIGDLDLDTWCERILDTVNGEEKYRKLTIDEFRKLEEFADAYIKAQEEFIKNNYPFKFKPFEDKGDK